MTAQRKRLSVALGPADLEVTKHHGRIRGARVTHPATTLPAPHGDLVEAAVSPAMPPANARLGATDTARPARGVVSFDPVGRSAAKPHSKALAIVAKCWQCIGGNGDPNPRQRIRECEVPRCALYPVRPYQRKGTP
jgi:hypothetical protein